VLPRSFAPSRPVGGGVRTAIWQYRFSCFALGGHQGLVDLDVATQEAFDEMW
jgi:hypothetical protein